jgi:hypothetical protein
MVGAISFFVFFVIEGGHENIDSFDPGFVATLNLV